MKASVRICTYHGGQRLGTAPEHRAYPGWVSVVKSVAEAAGKLVFLREVTCPATRTWQRGVEDLVAWLSLSSQAVARI